VKRMERRGVEHSQGAANDTFKNLVKL